MGAACAALSGAGAVIAEVGWAQGLGLVLGHGTVPVALVAATLLTGWACGSFVALAFLPHVRRPRRAYVLLEFAAVGAGAVVAGLLPRLAPGLAHLPPAWFGPDSPAPEVMRALAVGGLLLPPALLLGAALPLLAIAGPHRTTPVAGRVGSPPGTPPAGRSERSPRSSCSCPASARTERCWPRSSRMGQRGSSPSPDCAPTQPRPSHLSHRRRAGRTPDAIRGSPRLCSSGGWRP